MKHKPEISVITASYNRGRYLEKLIKSLSSQTFKNFEWIIGNDGSNDNTDQIIKNKKNKLKFNITYIRSTHRIGKAKMDNLLFERIKGKYVIYIGSADVFTSNALEHMLKLIKKIPRNKSKQFAGVIAQSVDRNGISQTFHPNKVPDKELTLIFEDYIEYIKGDDSVLEFSSNYDNKKYLEVDFVINESSMLSKVYLGKYFLISPKTVKIMYRPSDSTSFGKKMRYTRGSAHCIAEVEKFNKFVRYPFFKKIRLIINYWRYCFHGDISFVKAKQMWQVTNKSYLPILLYPLSFLICLRDNLLRKVEKTHIIFDQNIKKYKISIETFEMSKTYHQ